MKVLIIDDDAMIQRMASFMLKKLGHEAVTAGSGQEGLDKLRNDAPDMTLLDVEMPGMDGFQVLEAIRADAAIQDAKVCLMTGTLTDEVRAKADALGCCEYLHKPLTALELGAALN